MFKKAGEYSCEELLRSCQDYFGAAYWAWYQAALKVVGEEKTKEMLEALAEAFARPEVEHLRILWGREFDNLQQISQCMDVIHRIVAYEGFSRGEPPQWDWTDEHTGYEQIGHCPIHATTPEEFRDKGPTLLCTVYCHNIGQTVYAQLGATISQDQFLTKGDKFCGFHITREKPEKLIQIEKEGSSRVS